MAKKEKGNVLDVWYYIFMGSSPIALLSSGHICPIAMLMGSPPPRQPASNRDCFLPHGVDTQCKMHAIWWTFDAGVSWDQIQSLSPQVATFPQSTGTWFPLLACCHNTYIELIPWHRTSDCQHATSCCHPFGEDLVFKCLKYF